MENVGFAALQIIPSFRGFDGHLERGASGPMGRAGTSGGTTFGDAAGKSAGSRFGGVFSKLAKASLLGVLGAGAIGIKVAGDSIEAASDLNESLNAVNVTYGKQADAVKKLGEEAAESLGLSNTEFNGLAVQFSAFASQVAGGDGSKVAGVLDDLTTRGSDFASVMNLDVNEALGLFQSGLAGESEPLRKYGIDLSAAAVEAYGLAKGLVEPTKNLLEIKEAQLDATDAQADYNEAVKEHGRESDEAKRASLNLTKAQNDLKAATKGSVSEMTEGEKVQARYGLLMEKTTKTQGDFRNTSDELANTQRRLNANWENAKAKLGTALLPVLTDAANYLNDKGIPAFEKAADFFVEDFAPAVGELAEDLKPVASALKDVVGFLNDLPSGAKLAALGTALSGGAFLKLRGGRGGALGTAGSALGFAKPVPVIVTNPGFGAGGVPGAAGGGKSVPPIVAGGGALAALKGSLGKLPRFAPFTPVGLGSAPGQDSLMKSLTGFGASGNPDGGINATASAIQEVSAIQEAFEEGRASASEYAAYVRRVNEQTGASFDLLPIQVRAKLGEVAQSFKAANLPTQLKTEIALDGVPESMQKARDLVRQYDLTPKQKQTLFQLIGYDSLMSQIRTINTQLDYASRDRRTQVTIAYANAGYETKGGLQSGAADTYSSNRNFEKATGRMGQ